VYYCQVWDSSSDRYLF
nr:immunoglobulin light chain junction region [Macaca mulatta]